MNCPDCHQPLEVVPRIVKGSPFIRVQCVNRKCGAAVMWLGDDQEDAEKDFTEQHTILTGGRVNNAGESSPGSSEAGRR